MKLYHLTLESNENSILRHGLLISKSNWGNYIYLTNDVKKCIKVYSSLPLEIMSIFKVKVNTNKLIKDPLHPECDTIVGFAYSEDIPSLAIKLI